MLEGEALAYSRDEVHFWPIPETRFTSVLFQRRDSVLRYSRDEIHL